MFLDRPDVVIATSPQLLVGLAGWWVARCKRVPFIFEVRDLWPESLAAVGVGTESSWLHRALTKIARFLYRNSDHIVVVTAAFKAHLVRHWRIPAGRISIIENGVESSIFSPHISHDEIRRELSAEGKFMICYAGTLGMAHGLKTLVSVAERMQREAPNVLFLLIGEGAEKEHIVSLAQARNLTNIRFLGQQPRTRIPAYIAASDAGLVLLKKTELFKTVIPTKLLECMSCGRPVILGVDGQARKLVQDAQAGLFFQPEDKPGLAQAILSLAANPQLRELMGRNGRRYALRHFSREHTAGLYLQLLQDMLGESSRPRSAAA
jgi:glycosyltransferase involved in cell wall biosynthesis